MPPRIIPDTIAVANATVTLLGSDWGDVPLWRLAPEGEAPEWSIDVHATNADQARQAALDSLATSP